MSYTRIEEVNQFRARLKAGLEDARFSTAMSKARQKAYSSQRYTIVSYAVGQKVWLHMSLFRDSVSKRQESKKLSARRLGPLEIFECVGKNSVRVKLPANAKIHHFLTLYIRPHIKNNLWIFRGRRFHALNLFLMSRASFFSWLIQY